MKPGRLLQRLERGELRNVRFRDLVRLAEALGFRRIRQRGSHHIFAHPEVPGLLNLQHVRGEAKPYQIRQLLRTIHEYDLSIGAPDE